VIDRSRSVHLALLWLPVIIYMAAIFIVSGQSDPPMPENVPDVSLHGLAYCGLALLLIRALSGGQWRGVTIATLAAAVVIAVLYGASDEWHQSFVPHRTPDWRDLRADAIGASAAAVGVRLWDIIRRL
jgi:VanZ family protein